MAISTVNPVRYPGGKGSKSIVERVLSLYQDGYLNNRTWIEPFCGGCGLGLSLVTNQAVKRAEFYDSDMRICSMWHEIAYDSENLIKKIYDADIDMRLFEWAKETANDGKSSIEDMGFATYVLNRCCHSGYIDGGVIGGKKQNGTYKLDCRFNKPNIIKRIRKIAELANAGLVSFNEPCDALVTIGEIPDKFEREDVFVYADPPYVQMGAACYRRGVDHEHLADALDKLYRNGYEWLLSYDDCSQVRDMYDGYRFEPLVVSYSNNGKTRGKTTEVLVMSD